MMLVSYAFVLEGIIACRLRNGRLSELNTIHQLAEELASGKLPVIAQLEPIADFEELYTFAEANPTPVVFSPQNRVWRLESVAARIV